MENVQYSQGTLDTIIPYPPVFKQVKKQKRTLNTLYHLEQIWNLKKLNTLEFFFKI